MVDRPHDLQYYGEPTAGAYPSPTDINNYVVSIDKFTDVGTGEVVSAQVMLDARFGDFITSTDVNSPPIIMPYDLFRLTLTDDKEQGVAGDTYTRYLIADDRYPQKITQGTQIQLEFFGRERFLQKMYMPGHYYFRTDKEMLKIIIEFYNSNRGANQPEVEPNFDQVPDYPVNTYDFRIRTTVYSALMQVVKHLSLPVPAQGAGEYYALRFEDHDSDPLDTMQCYIFPQGNKSKSTYVEPILEVPLKITSTRQPEQETIHVVQGQETAGTYPNAIARWRGLVEEFENMPAWDGDFSYDSMVYVRYEGHVYQSSTSIASNESDPDSNSSWGSITLKDYIDDRTGGGFRYSPYTDGSDVVDRYQNCCGNPTGTFDTDYDSVAVFDSNLVIRDNVTWRDWAHVKTTGSLSVLNPFLIDGEIPEGTRILLNTPTPLGSFTGTDDFGRSYANALVQRTRITNDVAKWLVIRNPDKNDQVAILREGRVYEFQNSFPSNAYFNARKGSTSGTMSWRDISSTPLGNDCFHYPNSIESVDGLIGHSADKSIADLSSVNHYRNRSAIKWTYTFAVDDAWTQIFQALDELHNFIFGTETGMDENGNEIDTSFTGNVDNADRLIELDTYTAGWWAPLFVAPFPPTDDQGQTVGELFKNPVMDLNNLNLTPSGLEGWNQADSDELGPLTGIGFLFNWDWQIGGNREVRAPTGDLPFRITMYDTDSNVYVTDFTYRFLRETQYIYKPFSSFRIYRARTAIALDLENIISATLSPEIKILEQFEKRKMKFAVVQSMMSYDNEGRYQPWTWFNLLLKTLGALGGDVTYTGTIDALSFIKSPIAIAKVADVFDMHLMGPVKQYPNVNNLEQLKKIASAEMDITNFQNHFVSTMHAGRCDSHSDNSAFFKDADLFDSNEADDSNGDPIDNTIKLIVRKITHSVNEADGTSGFMSTFNAYRKVAT